MKNRTAKVNFINIIKRITPQPYVFVQVLQFLAQLILYLIYVKYDE